MQIAYYYTHDAFNIADPIAACKTRVTYEPGKWPR